MGNDNNIKKEKYHFFRRIVLSVTNISAYKAYIHEPLSYAIKYFFLLILVLNVIPFLIYSRYMYIEIRDFNEWGGKNLPEMSVKNGIISCDGEQPIKLVYKDFWKITIDTNDTIKRIDPELDDGAYILVNSEKISVKILQSKQQAYYILKELSLEINQETLSENLKKAFLILLPLGGVLMYVMILITKSLQIIFFSMLFSIIFSILCMRMKIPNPGKINQFFITGIYGITASLCLETLMKISGFYFSYLFLLYYGIYLYYLFQVFKNIILKQPEMGYNIKRE